jgi:hypothetical protein
MNLLKKAWLTFRQLKTWLQIVIVILLLSLIGAIGGGGTSSTESNSNKITTKSTTEPTDDATPEESPTPAPTPAVSDAEFKSALAKMRIKKDDVKNLKFYEDKSSPKYVNANGFSLYVGQQGTSDPNLYLDIQYYGSDWLFIQSYFFNIDGETYEIATDYGDVETDNDSNVWEWYNHAATSENIEMVEKIIASKKTVMRLEGRQYHKDVTISQTQKTALRNILTVYQGLGGTF